MSPIFIFSNKFNDKPKNNSLNSIALFLILLSLSEIDKCPVGLFVYPRKNDEF